MIGRLLCWFGIHSWSHNEVMTGFQTTMFPKPHVEWTAHFKMCRRCGKRVFKGVFQRERRHDVQTAIKKHNKGVLVNRIRRQVAKDARRKRKERKAKGIRDRGGAAARRQRRAEERAQERAQERSGGNGTPDAGSDKR